MKIKTLTLTSSEVGELTFGFRNGESHCFRMRCRAILLKSEGLSSVKVGEQTEMTTQSINGWVKRFMPKERSISLMVMKSHVCTEGYVPYGWQFPKEDVYVPSEKAKRLNIFGMIDRDNHFESFSTSESIEAQKVVDFPERLSFGLSKKTFVVLDNASVHRNDKIKQMRPA